MFTIFKNKENVKHAKATFKKINLQKINIKITFKKESFNFNYVYLN